MIDFLKSLMMKKKYVCVHADEANPSRFIFGKLIGLDSAFFAISMVSPEGDYDGVLIKPIEDVIYTETSNSYEKNMSVLMKRRGFFEKIIEVDESDLLRWSLSYAMDNRTIVSIELCHSGVDDVSGFVSAINENICQVKCVDNNGVEDGFSYIKLSEITQLCFDSCDEQRLFALYVSNQENDFQ